MILKTWSTPVIAEERRLIPCALCGGGLADGGHAGGLADGGLAGGRFKPSLSCEGFSYVKCAACGLVQMNPQPTVAAVRQRYGQSFGDDYLAYEIKNEAAFLNLQKLALADAGFDRMERELKQRSDTLSGALAVLDVGCATGALLAFLRERGWRTTGVEISPSADYARQERGLDVRRQNLEDCQFPAETFDLALASHIIEHLNDPAAFLHEIGRVLRRGAYLLLTTPNINGFQARMTGSRWRSAIFDHLYLFSIRTVTAMLKKYDFTVEGVYTWGGLAAGIAPAPVKALADKAAKALGVGDVMLIKARKPELNPP